MSGSTPLLSLAQLRPPKTRPYTSSFLSSQVWVNVDPRVWVPLPQHRSLSSLIVTEEPPRSVICASFFPSLRPRAGLVVLRPVCRCGIRTHGDPAPFPRPPAPGSLTSFTIKSVKMSPRSPLFSIHTADQREARSLPITLRRAAKRCSAKEGCFGGGPRDVAGPAPSSSHTATFPYTGECPPLFSPPYPPRDIGGCVSAPWCSES